MENFKKMRTPLRGAFTRVNNSIVNELAEENPNKQTLKTNLEILEIKLCALKEVDDKILQQMLEDEVSDDEYSAESYVIQDFTEKYVHSKNMVLAVVKTKPEHTQSVVQVADLGAKRKMRLPKLELPKFAGDIKDWLTFWSCYKKIDEDVELEPEEKFQYLLQSVVKGSRAYEVVDSYPPTAENYPKAIESLKNRFGRDDLQVEVYVRELLKLVLNNNLSKERVNLTKLYDTLESYTRALSSLGVTTDKCGTILYPLVESCLPDEVLRAWQRGQAQSSVGVQGEKADYENRRLSQLMGFLRSEVEGEERIKMARSGFGLAQRKDKTRSKEEDVPTAAGLFSGDKKPACIFCTKDNHPSHSCYSVKKMSLTERYNSLRKSGGCRLCLKSGHFANNCTSDRKCSKCGGKHHVLLCGDKEKAASSNDGESSGGAVAPVTQNCISNCSSPVVALQTLMCNIKCGSKSKRVRAIIDSGSQRSYVLDSTARELGLEQVGDECINHALFGGSTSGAKQHQIYKFELGNVNGKYSFVVSALDQNKICSNILRVRKGTWLKELKGRAVYLSDLGEDCPAIEVLLGADVAGKLLTGSKLELQCGLVAVETKLGWTLIGKVPGNVSNCNSSSMLVASLMSSHSDIDSLWKLEAIGITDPAEVKSRAELELAALKHFQETVKINAEGRYEVCLPWLASSIKVGTNRSIAQKRLEATTAKLTTSGHIVDYGKVLEEWLEEGIVEKVLSTEIEAEAHYLPHRAVIKTSSATTKIRPVFDASSHEKGFPSLNDCLEKGPNLIEKIPSVLLRFREEQFGVISDIKKAFLQISVDPRDRNYMRFLWWADRERKTLCVYRHVRVVFGVSCSPFLLGAVISHHLNSVSDCSADTIKRLKDSFYVDNCVTSVGSNSDYEIFMKESKVVMDKGGFDLRGWERSGIYEETWESQVLGLVWDKRDDTLSVGSLELDLDPQAPVTKRRLLSTAHRLYDPLGFTCPVSLFPKILLQKAWELKIGWDKELPEELRDKFLNWSKELKVLEQLKIPRWLTSESVSKQRWSVHTFCDASKLSYAAVVYIRVETSNGTTVQLAVAKSRVAPVRQMTIPRLELLACVIGVRITTSVVEALELKDVAITFWTDSSTALSWIRNEDEWNIFVGNRVKEIRGASDSGNWRHVPGAVNPADLPSRGCSPQQLLESRWWEGPDWLKECSDYWPKETVDYDEAVISSERRKTVKCPTEQNSLLCAGSESSWYLRLTSDFEQLLRHVCWLLKYRSWIKEKRVMSPVISVEELQAAELKVLQMVQAESFGTVSDKFIMGVSVQLGTDGLWRVKSKVERRDDAIDFKSPVILPANHSIVSSLIRRRHELLCHAGATTVLSNLREKFWIIRGRQAVNSVIRKCVICRRFDSSPLQAIPSPLPLHRVRDAAVFEVTGVDLAGPLFLKDGVKAWIVLFTCAVYRAVHLELVTALSTEAFLQALRRFIARRGRPSIIYSDQGKNFFGSDNAFGALNWSVISQAAGILRIRWKFNPATAAWWGGFWERLIRILKGLLKKVLGRAALLYEELVTVLCDCEAVINSRPLTYLSEDPNDLSALSPSLFLQDVKEVGVADIETIDANSLNRRVTYRQKVAADLKKRFRVEYLGQLIQRKKEKSLRPIRLGDIVLVGADNAKRIQWPLGRVVELVPGSDGNVRVAKLKTSSGILVRPVQRLYPLEVSAETSNNVSNTDAIPQEEVQEKQEEEVILREKLTRSGRPVKTPIRYV